jgi:YfiH family protein
MTRAPLVTIDAEWPAPPHVRVLTTTRAGGVSEFSYASLNLAMHVGDDPERVAVNRACLLEALRLPSSPVWLDQHHGTRVIDASRDRDRRADGSYTTEPGIVCAILTADCLPIILTDRAGTEVAALHAGWRGLAAGIIAAGVGRMRPSPANLIAWLGPAISVARYEVGQELYETFIGQAPALVSAFAPTRPGHYRCDLYAIARTLLRETGVTGIHGGTHCTHREAERFFSYRRDGGNGRDTGRMATLAWIEPPVSQTVILPRK